MKIFINNTFRLGYLNFKCDDGIYWTEYTGATPGFGCVIPITNSSRSILKVEV